MGDPLDDILRLVAEGRLSPEEAAPIVDALASARRAADRARASAEHARAAAEQMRAAAGHARAAGRDAARGFRLGFDAAPAGSAGGGSPPDPTPAGLPRRLRVQVRDGGRVAVDLQLPGVLAELAGAIPGIPAEYVGRVREALRTGVRGPIVEVSDEDGSGVTITIE